MIGLTGVMLVIGLTGVMLVIGLTGVMLGIGRVIGSEGRISAPLRGEAIALWPLVG